MSEYSDVPGKKIGFKTDNSIKIMGPDSQGPG